MVADQEQLSKLLRDWSRGDPSALERLTPIIYAELRKIARYHMSREAKGHTLQATALINEAYVKLVDMPQPGWKDREHFFAAASKIMRNVLVDYAKKKRSIKRGREMKRVSFEDAINLPSDVPAAVDVLVVDDALSKLSKIDERKARVFENWYFGGMTVDEIAKTLQIGTSTVSRDLEFAKVWLTRAVKSGNKKP
jgi:RNA polymerase sigma-70 factor, ECF subfamily